MLLAHMSAGRELADFLRACRKEAHLTQAQARVAIDIDASTISKWENGKQLPDPQRLGAISAAYQIDHGELTMRFTAAQQEELREKDQTINMLVAAMKGFVDKYGEFHAAYEEISERVRRLDDQFEARMQAAIRAERLREQSED